MICQDQEKGQRFTCITPKSDSYAQGIICSVVTYKAAVVCVGVGCFSEENRIWNRPD